MAQLFSLGGIARIMRFIPFFLLVVLLAGCDRSETQLHRQIAGSWVRDSQFEMSLSADGSFVSHWTLPDKSLTYQGTWQIQDGSMISTITNCVAEGTTNFEHIGSVDHWSIIQADRTRLVFSNKDGVISLTRK